MPGSLRLRARPGHLERGVRRRRVRRAVWPEAPGTGRGRPLGPGRRRERLRTAPAGHLAFARPVAV